MKPWLFVFAASSLLLSRSLALAVPVQGIFVDDARCDIVPQTLLSHELGDINAGFPTNEALAVQVTSGPVICVPDDGFPNDFAVSITNLTATRWVDLFFSADQGTTIGNSDGRLSDINSPGFYDAFRIDNLGGNSNLISGDTNNDLVFDPGESWVFLVSNFVAPASTPPFPVLGSIGRFSNSSGIDFNSNASILANPVPEPGTCVLLLLGAAGLALLARRKRTVAQRFT